MEIVNTGDFSVGCKQFNANRNALHAHNCIVTIAITLKKAYSVVADVMAGLAERANKPFILYFMHDM